MQAGRLAWAPQARPPHINTPEAFWAGAAPVQSSRRTGLGWGTSPPPLSACVPSLCLPASGLSSLVSCHSFGVPSPNPGSQPPDTVHVRKKPLPCPKLKKDEAPGEGAGGRAAPYNQWSGCGRRGPACRSQLGAAGRLARALGAQRAAADAADGVQGHRAAAPQQGADVVNGLALAAL